MPSNHLILCRPLLLPPSNFPSFRVFSNRSVLHIRWPEYWNFSFSISASNEYPGWISFRIDWNLIFLESKGLSRVFNTTVQSISSLVLKELWCSKNFALFMVQLSHPYMTTGKTIAMTRWTFVGKVMSLLFNMLPREVV